MKNNNKVTKYLLSGIISFIFEYTSFLILVYIFSTEAWLGQAISYSLTIIVNFVLLRYWAFGHDKSSLAGHAIKYGLLIAINLPVTTMLIYILTSINIPAFLAKLVVILLATIWNYIVYDKIVFRDNKRGV